MCSGMRKRSDMRLDCVKGQTAAPCSLRRRTRTGSSAYEKDGDLLVIEETTLDSDKLGQCCRSCCGERNVPCALRTDGRYVVAAAGTVEVAAATDGYLALTLG